jgi:hypothetical protein
VKPAHFTITDIDHYPQVHSATLADCLIGESHEHCYRSPDSLSIETCDHSKTNLAKQYGYYSGNEGITLALAPQRW